MSEVFPGEPKAWFERRRKAKTSLTFSLSVVIGLALAAVVSTYWGGWRESETPCEALLAASGTREVAVSMGYIAEDYGLEASLRETAARYLGLPEGSPDQRAALEAVRSQCR